MGKPIADPPSCSTRHDRKKVVSFERIKKTDLDPVAQKLIDRISVDFKE